MQKVSVTANRLSKRLATATKIAQAWMEQLGMDATLWTSAAGTTSSGGTTIANTTWLKLVGGSRGDQAAWFRPGWSATQRFGAAFDAFGRPMDETAENPANARFCVHLQLTRLQADLGAQGMIRAEVRVLWNRDGQGDQGQPFCTTAATVATVGADLQRYNSHYLTTVFKQSP